MSRKGGAEKPQRSCVSCHETRDKDALIRYVLSPEGEVLPDLEERLPGRGAYTCIDSRCLKTAIERRLFNRSFKRDVITMSSDAMITALSSQMRFRILGYLGLANRAGKVVPGSALVCEALRGRNIPELILVAVDASEGISGKVFRLAAAHNVRAERTLSKDDFGSILGKSPRSAIAVKRSGFTARLVREIERYENFLVEV